MVNQSTPEITMEAVIRLQPTMPVSREDLEFATMEVERALDEHTVDLADGASASANFKDGVIEIDLRLEGCSVGELHQKVTLVITQLDQYCGLNIAPLKQHGNAQAIPALPPISVRSSEAQVVFA